MGEDIKTNFYMGVEAAEEEEKAPGGLSGRGLRIVRLTAHVSNG